MKSGKVEIWTIGISQIQPNQSHELSSVLDKSDYLCFAIKYTKSVYSPSADTFKRNNEK